MTPQHPALITDEELAAVEVLADLFRRMQHIIGDGPTRRQDMAEATAHIHALQHMILAQAAARAYPDRYRTLGETVCP